MGGAPIPRISKGTTTTFKDVVKGKSSTSIEKIQNTPGLYIVEQM